MVPTHRLLARASHRIPLSPFFRVPGLPPPKNNTTLGLSRHFSGASIARQNDDQKDLKGQPVEGYKDKHNCQHGADMEGKQEKRADDASRAVSEKSGGSNESARKEFPEAPDTIGMQDERGGVWPTFPSK